MENLKNLTKDGDYIEISLPGRVKALPPYVFGHLNRVKYQKRSQGIDIIDLGMGNPNDPTPATIIDKLCEAVRDKRNHRYSDPQGILNLRREVANRYLDLHNVELDPSSEISCLIGSKEGFSHLCLALLEERDTVIAPNPYFPVHKYGPMLAGATVLTVPLREPDQFLRDIADLCSKVYPHPKMIVLNFPHNPTAMTVEPGFFDEAVKIAKKFGSIIIHDYAYGATTFDDYKAPSFLEARGAMEVGVELSTMSKEFNMAGWRVGYCAGHPQIVAALQQIKGYYDYGIFQPIQIASIIAIRECYENGRQQALTYQHRRDALCSGLARIGWTIDPPKATMFAWVPIPEKYRPMGSVAFAFELIEKADVAAAPGAAFGEEGEGYLRFALVENDLRLKQAIRQIGRVFPG